MYMDKVRKIVKKNKVAYRDNVIYIISNSGTIINILGPKNRKSCRNCIGTKYTFNEPIYSCIDELLHRNLDAVKQFFINGVIEYFVVIPTLVYANLPIKSKEIIITAEFKNGVLNGFYRDLEAEGYYKNGIKQGEWNFFYTYIDKVSSKFTKYERIVSTTCEYKDDVPTGTCVVYENEKYIVGNYNNGIKDGVWSIKSHNDPYEIFVKYSSGFPVYIVKKLKEKFYYKGYSEVQYINFKTNVNFDITDFSFFDDQFIHTTFSHYNNFIHF